MNPPASKRPASRPRNAFGSVANLFALAFIAIMLLFAFGLNRVVLSAAIAWIGAFLLVGCGVVPSWLANSLQTGAAPAPELDCKRIAIVLLGDGVVSSSTTGEIFPAWLAASRIAKATQVYLAARSRGSMCRLIVTGNISAGKGTRSAYMTNLVALGVAEPDIVLEARGENTYRQAEHTKQILQSMGEFDALILVTSGLHMKRALLYFRNVGLQPQPAPSDYVTAEFTLFPAAYNFAITDIACHQYVGIARMRLYNALGWNK